MQAEIWLVNHPFREEWRYRVTRANGSTEMGTWDWPIDDLAEAVVHLAYQWGLKIEEGEVAVDGNHAVWEE